MGLGFRVSVCSVLWFFSAACRQPRSGVLCWGTRDAGEAIAAPTSGVEGFGFRVSGLGFWVLGFGV